MPEIESYSFGSILIKGIKHEDIKIIGEKVIGWQYTKHHTVTVQDITEITDSNPEVIVIGTGASGLVKVEDEVIKLAEQKNIKLVIKPSAEACDEYNKLLKENKKVAAIIHSTC
ncbi:hypothetical protein CMO89_01830 [Candidatus Woesearchaeota archaeon]|nr:hypothetical protein [Candidatus Woesearchaeota archaeon]|tara:strand:+ start:1439 stop:1780 length:342 start_codon:yes stop_codon:yes gene_type:complete